MKSLDNLRESLEQAYCPNTTAIRDQSYFEEYTSRNRSSDISEIYHENTKLSDLSVHKMRKTLDDLEDSVLMRLFQARVSPDYLDNELIELPTEVEVSGDIEELLKSRRSVREYSQEGLSREQLSQIILYGYGPTFEQRVTDPQFTVTQTFRAYPSAGALYPIELYLLVLNAKDLERGIYYYSLEKHGLRKLTVGDSFDADLDDIIFDPIIDAHPGALFILTGSFWRSKVKYGSRGYRYVLQESGHIVQNFQLISHAIAVGTVPLASFHDDRLNKLIGVDGVNEAVVYAMAAGNRPADLNQ